VIRKDAANRSTLGSKYLKILALTDGRITPTRWRGATISRVVRRARRV